MNDGDEDTTRLGQQRDANEQLVLALLRESARADRAEKRERELRDVAAFRERLIGIVGHDLRNPLNAVLMAGGLLISNGRLSPPDAALARRVVDSSRRMQRIIIQVLEFTRARLGGGFVLERKPTDLCAVSRRIAGELRLAKHCTIDIQHTGDVTGSWDGELLGEVLSNIAGNAVQHAAPDTRVVITLVGRRASVSASIRNEGETIPAKVRRNVFDPFRRGQADVPDAGSGLGLGLYIASEIVRAHAGRIDVVSEKGATTFTVVLPRAPRRR